MAIQGIMRYPGIEQWSSVRLTDISGISPTTIEIEMLPQDGVPDLDGDLVLENVDDSGSSNFLIRFSMCHIAAAYYERGSGGKVVRVILYDERWKWAFGEINGQYNFKIVKCYDAAFSVGAATQFIDPDHEKTPQELASLCISAMGYADSDWYITALPNDARPEVDWVYANPAQELARICDQFGCRIVPVRSTGKWAIVKTGDGKDLPDIYPYQDPGDGIDPTESPDYLRLVTAEILFECRLNLIAIGLDTDKVFRELADLSYCPNIRGTSTFQYSDPTFADISNTRIQQADGSLISPRELAQQTVLKCFKIGPTQTLFIGADDSDTSIPGYAYGLDISQLVLTETLVEPYIETGNTSANQKPAFVEGSFRSDLRPADTGNYPLGTRVDLDLKAAKFTEDLDDCISFSLSNSEDCRYAVISFSRMITKGGLVTSIDGAGMVESLMLIPDLHLHTAVKIRDPDTWKPVRDSRLKYIGKGREPALKDKDPRVRILPIVKPEIQPWYRGVYAADGTLLATIGNQDSVTRQCAAYLDSIAETFETVRNSTRRYIGIYPIDMDGAIQQITYVSSTSGGADTIASLNTEHDFEIPEYSDRRSREARKNSGNLEARSNEIMADLRIAGLAG